MACVIRRMMSSYLIRLITEEIGPWWKPCASSRADLDQILDRKVVVLKSPLTTNSTLFTLLLPDHIGQEAQLVGGNLITSGLNAPSRTHGHNGGLAAVFREQRLEVTLYYLCYRNGKQ